MRKSKTKTANIYDIGDGLELINVCVKDPSTGKLDRVNTFIGNHNRQEYLSVAGTKGLSEPGVIFSYSSYVREQEMLIPLYKQIYQDNLHGKVYMEDGRCYIVENNSIRRC